MSAVAVPITERCDTRFEADTFFNFPDECDEQQRGIGHDTHTPLPTDDSADTPKAHVMGLPEPGKTETASTQLDTDDMKSGFDEKMVHRKSDLLNNISIFKSKHPEKMTLPEYMMHAYVIIHTKNPNTILTYEIITAHTQKDADEFPRTLAAQTLSRLEQEDFGVGAADLLHTDFNNHPELTQLDQQFTWIGQMCSTAAEETEEEVEDQSIETTRDDSDATQKDANAADAKTVENDASITFADLMKVTDLPNDVMYEALRLHGNRLVQRSVYGSGKGLYAGNSSNSNQNAAAKVNATSAEIKGFMENIQKYSIDNKVPNQYYGEERRMTTRQSALLRKKYL